MNLIFSELIRAQEQKDTQMRNKTRIYFMTLLTFIVLTEGQTALGESGLSKKPGGGQTGTPASLSAPIIDGMGKELRQKLASGDLRRRDAGFYTPLSGGYSFCFTSKNKDVGVVWECTPEQAFLKFNELVKAGNKSEKFIKKCGEGAPSGYVESVDSLASGNAEYFANIYTGEGYVPHSLSLYMHGDKAWVELVFFKLINEELQNENLFRQYPGLLNRKFREEKRAAELAAKKQTAEEQAALDEKQRAIAEEKRIAEKSAQAEQVERDAKTTREKRLAKISDQVTAINPSWRYRGMTGLNFFYDTLINGASLKEHIGEVVTLTEAGLIDTEIRFWWEVLQAGNNFALLKPRSRDAVYKFDAETQQIMDNALFMLVDTPDKIRGLMDGQRVNGLFVINGTESYKTPLGVQKTVPCLIRLDIAE